jgi:hypothetical protein
MKYRGMKITSYVALFVDVRACAVIALVMFCVDD